ncbi:hypothetical protein BGZ79_002505 [Entomortierella chlamydospora]|nr:hypothetical protein BGZ79_002505 [Entomortierella chlamydospora]
MTYLPETYRITHTIKAQATTECEHPLVNFVITKALLASVLPEDISSDAAKYIFPDEKPVCISPSEQNFVAQLCAMSATYDFVATQEWVNGDRVKDSMIHRAVANFISEATLWARTDWSRDPLRGGKRRVAAGEQHIVCVLDAAITSECSPNRGGGLQCQFQGLVKILQVRIAMRATIESYGGLQMAKVDDEGDEVDDSRSETDVSWLHKEPPV